MFGIHRNFPAGGGGSTGDATAEQWDIKNGKTAYIASGKVTGTGYFPAMMKFDGSTGYYYADYTSSGNKVTGVVLFLRESYTGDTAEIVFRADGSSAPQRMDIVSFSSDFSAQPDKAGTIQVRTRNSAGTDICMLFANGRVDGKPHVVFYEFDGDAGTAVFIVDGTDELATPNTHRISPTAGTLGSGVASKFAVGAVPNGNLPHGGLIGFCGMSDVGGLDWSDFMHPDGSPKDIESTLNTVWGGGAPAFWHESAKMDESATPMTKNGSIILAPASSWS